MPLLHAKLSASGSARWLTCPASVKVTEAYERTTSSAAEEGTCAHELGDLVLRGEITTPHEKIGHMLSDAPTVMVTEEMADYVQGYVNYCREHAVGGELLPEQRVNFSPWVPEGFGTSDCITFVGDTCHVIDLKYGKGIEVYAEENSQAMLYALGVLNEYDWIYEPETFYLHIYQPRRDHFDVWMVTKADLLAWGEWVIERAALCWGEDAEFGPSEKGCQWCQHKPNCKALQEHTEKVICSQFEDLDLPPVEEVDTANVLRHKGLIESWLKAVEQNAFEKATNGEKVEGFKLVHGISRRKWASEDDAFKELIGVVDESELFARKLLSVAQAEKLLGKADFNSTFAHLVTKPEGKATLVPDSDRRPAINDVSDDFEQLD